MLRILSIVELDQKYDYAITGKYSSWTEIILIFNTAETLESNADGDDDDDDDDDGGGGDGINLI